MIAGFLPSTVCRIRGCVEVVERIFFVPSEWMIIYHIYIIYIYIYIYLICIKYDMSVNAIYVCDMYVCHCMSCLFGAWI